MVTLLLPLLSRLGLPASYATDIQKLLDTVAQDEKWSSWWKTKRKPMIVGGCILYYTKTECLPIKAIDVAEVLQSIGIGIDDVAVGKAYRKLSEQLGTIPKLCQLRPAIFLEYLFNKIADIPAETKRVASDLNRRVVEKRAHIGKSPSGTAGAIFYLAMIMTESTGWSVTQREIADVCGVAEVTIRNRYLNIVRILKLELNPILIEMAKKRLRQRNRYRRRKEETDESMIG